MTTDTEKPWFHKVGLYFVYFFPWREVKALKRRASLQTSKAMRNHASQGRMSWR